MALPMLYTFRRCPYAIRARLALRYANIEVELREVVLRDKPAEMLAVSPKGTVPVLQLANGSDFAVIDESLEIMFWALAQSDPEGWLAVDIEEANHLIAANDDGFKVWLDRYKYPEWHEDVEQGESREHCEVFIRQLERRLVEHPYLLGASPSIVDYSLYSFVRQFANVDIEWFSVSEYKATNKWLQDFLDSSLFAAVMHKYPQWKHGADVVIF